MVSARLFVEGGGDSKALRTACREGFRKLLEEGGMKGRLPRIVPCGPRSAAYDDFSQAISDGDGLALLLVDSEAPVNTKSPWEHVKKRQGDGWDKPGGAADEHLHLMVLCMETWFLADRDALARFFGDNFRAQALPTTADIETVAKKDLLAKLKQATRDTTKGAYGKGDHSFPLLATLSPAKLRAASKWAERLFETSGC